MPEIENLRSIEIDHDCFKYISTSSFYLSSAVLRIMDDKLMIHVNKNTNSLNETNENQCLLILLIKLFKSDYERFC